ncbi:hypothetical protein BT67DRAFT_442000 [Trichocladium antarcticum]|uniref:Uncharacterized protein n=1 Tax=Trichocladium antarcticum TaxID=1450529 RepID=A0AAN6ZDA8_9PEZI|nr:hypothetical protein BT67DRAFT_442000 [Trichocladium antarcticum]
MQLSWVNLVLSVFVTASLSLPVNDHRHPRTPTLVPRATYSVVPIDGGAGSGGSGRSGGSGGAGGSTSGSGPGNPPDGGSVTVTVVETQAPKISFHTVYMTRPPVTDRVTDTVVVTKTIQIVDIGPETTPASHATPATPTTRPTPTASSRPTLTTPTSTSTSTSIAISAISSTAAPARITSSPSMHMPLQTAFSSSSSRSSRSTTQDGGSWHTTYPGWNSTLARRSSRRWLRPGALV